MATYSEEDFQKLREDLVKVVDQAHLFSSFDDASEDDKERLANQIRKLDSTTPGGLVNYCQRGKKLLKEVKDNPALKREYAPPKLGEKLRANTPLFEECEELGIGQSPFAAFVLVAGGLGERLNYDGAKVGIETDTLSGKTFLQSHCDWISAFQRRAQIIMNDAEYTSPFAIMSSDDTHSAIIQLLNENGDGTLLGGLTDVTVLKQEKVPCFSNLKGDISLNPEDIFEVVTKPHGHGDLHSLLHKSGIIDRWQARGIRWIVVFQDTNVLAFRAVSAALGSSVKNKMDMSMVAVQRRRGEAIGAICQTKLEDGTERTLNVEYNLINEDQFSSNSSDESSSGNSVFPGNINLLVFNVKLYAESLKKSGGVVPEFVNPKFADAAKTEFKSPTRLECMMQDLPLLLPPQSRVGYIEVERFLCFSAVKNNLKDALTKYQETGYPESASSCESDLYSTCRKLLAMSGCQVRTTALPMRRFSSLPFEDGARVVLCPSFGTTVAEIRSRFPTPQHVHISDRSALLLDGDIIIHQLELDGHLVIRTKHSNARIVIKSLRVVNEGSFLEQLQTIETGNNSKSVESSEHLNGNGTSQSSYTSSERVRGFRSNVKEMILIESDHSDQIVIERPF